MKTFDLEELTFGFIFVSQSVPEDLHVYFSLSMDYHLLSSVVPLHWMQVCEGHLGLPRCAVLGEEDPLQWPIRAEEVPQILLRDVLRQVGHPNSVGVIICSGNQRLFHGSSLELQEELIIQSSAGKSCHSMGCFRAKEKEVRCTDFMIHKNIAIGKENVANEQNNNRSNEGDTPRPAIALPLPPASGGLHLQKGLGPIPMYTSIPLTFSHSKMCQKVYCGRHGGRAWITPCPLRG